MKGRSDEEKEGFRSDSRVERFRTRGTHERRDSGLEGKGKEG